jgi:hypothetical protein
VAGVHGIDQILDCLAKGLAGRLSSLQLREHLAQDQPRKSGAVRMRQAALLLLCKQQRPLRISLRGRQMPFFEIQLSTAA